MSLKTATVTNLINAMGVKESFTLSIKSVVFDYEGQPDGEGNQLPFVEVIFRKTPADFVEGMQPQYVSARMVVDMTDADISGIVMQTSNKVWALIQDAPCLNTFSDGRPQHVSLKDAKAKITNVDAKAKAKEEDKK